MANPIRWGVLATGSIAHTFARGLEHSSTGKLAAVGSRSRESAERFGGEFGVPAWCCHPTYEALLADPDVDAVYISTPHPGHAEWTIKAAQAGKHILCEKPLSMNAAEAATMFDAAHRHGVFLMEAFKCRCHPQTHRLVELIRGGAVGAVRMIQATFSFRAPPDAPARLFDPALGGGGILDVGCYPASMTRLLAGAAVGQPFSDPVELAALGHFGETGVDNYTAAVARFPGDIIAQLSCGLTVLQNNSVRVYGEDGWIDVPEPWWPGVKDGVSRLLVHRPGATEPEAIVITTPTTPAYHFTLEADCAAAHLARGEAPEMTWADSLGNMRMLDRWQAAVAGGAPG